jgi:hypothetical protein
VKSGFEGSGDDARVAARGPRNMTATAPILVLLVLLGIVSWVHSDAKARAERGAPVIFAAGNLRLDTPAAWAIACLVLGVIAFPLYLTSRQQPPGPRGPRTL